jgi:hypothetical protein
MFVMITGLMQGSTVAFLAGVVAVGSSVPDTRLQSDTAARVRTWLWLNKDRAGTR